jgi:hypothetical protein
MKETLKEITDMNKKLHKKVVNTCRELGVVRRKSGIGWVLTREGWGLLNALSGYAEEEHKKREMRQTMSAKDAVYIG